MKNKAAQLKEAKRRLKLYKESIEKGDADIIVMDDCDMCNLAYSDNSYKSCYRCILGDMDKVFKRLNNCSCFTAARNRIVFGEMDAIEERYLELESYLMEKGYIS